MHLRITTKYFAKALALFLSITMVINFFPYSVWSIENNSSDIFSQSAATIPSANSNISTIVSTTTHSAMLRSGTLYMWGSNTRRQLPGVTISYTAKPIQIESSKQIRDVAVTPNRTLILYTDNSLVSYGLDPVTNMVSGNGKLIADNVTKMSAWQGHVILIKSDYSVWTFGINSHGQLGNSSFTSLEYPVKMNLSNIKSVAAGADFSLALGFDGTLYGWGNNDRWQLGVTDPATIKPIPTPIPESESSENSESIADDAETDEQTIFLEGQDTIPEDNYSEDAEGSSINGLPSSPTDSAESETGESSSGETDPQEEESEEKPIATITKPTVIATGIDAVYAGLTHTVIIKNDKTLWTAGDNSLGQLGQGNNVKCGAFNQVMVEVTSASVGTNSTFVGTSDSLLYYWGDGEKGQLGNGSGNISYLPTLSTLDFIEVYQTYNNAFGIDAAGNIWSWGENTNLRTAKNGGANSSIPAKILNIDTDWVYNLVADINKTQGTENEQLNGISRSFAAGYSDNTFMPDKNVTRAEFLKMAIHAMCVFDENAASGTNKLPFSDVSKSEWFYKYVAFGYENNIIGGYEDGTFRPDAPITRAAAATIIANMLSIMGEKSSFEDVATDHWAFRNICALSSLKIISGYEDGTFKPNRYISRSETVKIISASSGFSPVAQDIPSLLEQGKISFVDIKSDKWYNVYILRAIGAVK